MLFLDEKAALSEIKSMLANAREAKIAVAFWGRGASASLGLARASLDVTVICNLDSGACNPREVGDILKALPEKRVFSDPRLHAKVYWTPTRAIVGSSNASANGLAVEGRSLDGWAEGNILIEDVLTLEQIKEWFELRLKASYEIKNSHLQLAADLWDRRSRAAPPGARISGNLFEAYQRAPNHRAWQRIKLALWTRDVDAEAQQEASAFAEKDALYSMLDYYQDWPELNSGQYLVDFRMLKSRSRYNGIYLVTDLRGPTLTFVREQGSLLLPGMPLLELTDGNVGDLIKVVPALFKKYSAGGESALVPFEDAMAALMAVNSEAVVDLNLLALTLRDTYEKARKLGYRPQRFLGMLDQLGPKETIKALLRPGRIPEGLSKLALLGRLDLSVEDIALRSEWRSLFEPEERAEAGRRLGRRENG